MNFVDDYCLICQAEQSHENMLGLQRCQQCLVDGSHTEGGQQSSLPMREPLRCDHGQFVRIIVDAPVPGRKDQVIDLPQRLELRRQGGVAVEKLQLDLGALVPVLKVFPNSAKHLIAGRLGRQGKVMPVLS